MKENMSGKTLKRIFVKDVEEIMKLRQIGTVEEYQSEFEDVRVRLERFMPNLGETYFLLGFVGGLKVDIRPMVRMMKPSSLPQAFQVAKFQE